jgi:hypothetical protein
LAVTKGTAAVQGTDSKDMAREEGQTERFCMLRQIGSTTYAVNVYFSGTSRETMADKIARMIREDVGRP